MQDTGPVRLGPARDLATGQPGVRRIVVDDRSAYWFNDAVGATTPSALMKINTDGSMDYVHELFASRNALSGLHSS